MRPLLILRDVLIVWGFTFVGGFVIGFVAGIGRFTPSEFIIAMALNNLLFGAAAFALIGCIAPPGRWRHLFHVALFAWLSTAINIVLFGATVDQWLLSSIAVLIMMGVGGAISFVFKKEPIDETRSRSSLSDLHRTPAECPMCGARVASSSTSCSECGEVFSY